MTYLPMVTISKGSLFSFWHVAVFKDRPAVFSGWLKRSIMAFFSCTNIIVYKKKTALFDLFSQSEKTAGRCLKAA